MPWKHCGSIVVIILCFTVSIALAEHPDHLIAIDVLLKPDSSMEARAKQWNALLHEQSPDGFLLDEKHAPHITLVQLYIDEYDLPAVLVAIEQVRSAVNNQHLKLMASGLYHMAMAEKGLAGIVIKPVDSLQLLQQAVIAAVYPFIQFGGSEVAFAKNDTGMSFEPLITQYVQNYIADQAGEYFNPHLTIGLAPIEFLERIEAEAFQDFEFGIEEMAVYQLGNFGTAVKRLDVKVSASGQ
ncbi:2'-5' RNA ligase family protein [Endozoicomonas ascidiicola]|uniref:2'-5' RNA ligase family protein n=1 Tax=Endozoicomonas ascidiicola TaxID=1698521 RepID=UPI000B299A72|nr:hypothetical protein [Endozoicomonas ascidiicola]